MASVKDYEKRLNEIVEPVAKHGKLNLHWDTVTDAKLLKANITQVQKQLRLLKKDIGLTIKATNASFQSEKTKVGKTAGSVVFGGIFGKKALGQTNASIKDSMRKKQIAVVGPYETLSRNIDAYITGLDQAKLKLDEWMLTHK